jgi:GNAT superfamily N-acetyltransferase
VSEARPLSSLLKPLAQRLVRDYEIYWIFRCDRAAPLAAGRAPCTVAQVDEAQVRALSSPLLRGQAWYAGEQTHAFLALHRGEPAGLCFYWFGARYQSRNFWPLQAGEAKLVQVIVDPLQRGRGIATALIALSAAALTGEGFRTLYARVWHSNAPSIAAFKRAGWRRVALVVTVQLPGTGRRLRVVLPRWRK